MDDTPQGQATGWAAVPRWVLWETELSAAARLVLVALMARENRAGECWPAHETLARDTALSVASVKRGLQELRSAGLVTWQRRVTQSGGATSNIYTVTARPVDNQGSIAHTELGGSSQGARGWVTQTQGVAHSELLTYLREQPTKNEHLAPDGASVTPVDNSEAFEAFMSAYPRPVARAAARRAWDAINADPALVVTAAAAFARTQKHIEPRWIPYPSTWLRERRWEDQDTPTQSRADRPGPEPPHGLDGRAYTTWLRAVRAAMGRGASDDEAAAAGAAAVSEGHDTEGAVA